MVHEPAFATRASRSFLLLLAILGLQVAPAGPVADASAPSQPRLAAAFLLPAAPLPASSVDGERGNGEGRAEPESATIHAGTLRIAAATGACGSVFCPWRARDALSRAGRRSSPTTAPPLSPV